MAECGEVLRFRELPAVIRNGGAHKCEQHHGKHSAPHARNTVCRKVLHDLLARCKAGTDERANDGAADLKHASNAGLFFG